jgi:flagellar protein FliL
MKSLCVSIVLLLGLNCFAGDITLELQSVTGQLKGAPNSLTITPYLEVNTQQSVNELKNKEPFLCKSIERIITSKTYQDVSTSQGKEALKQQIYMELNRQLTKSSQVQKVYFTVYKIE